MIVQSSGAVQILNELIHIKGLEQSLALKGH